MLHLIAGDCLSDIRIFLQAVEFDHLFRHRWHIRIVGKADQLVSRIKSQKSVPLQLHHRDRIVLRIAEHGQAAVHDLFHHIAADHMAVNALAAGDIDGAVLAGQQVDVAVIHAVEAAALVIFRHKLRQHLILKGRSRLQIIEHGHLLLAPVVIDHKQIIPDPHPLGIIV